MKKLITPKKLIAIVLLLFVFLSYNALGKNGQNKSLALVSMVGVDMIDDKFLVSAKVIVPSSTREGSSSERVFSNTGDTISRAVFNIELMLGHKLGMGHCDLIALSDPVLDTGIEKVTDYFIRTKKIAHTALLIACGESAKDMMFATSYMSNILLIKTDAIMKFNKSNLKAMSISLDDFYKSYESESKITIIPSLKLSTSDTQGVRVKIGPSDANNMNTEGETKYFINDGQSYVLNKGVRVWTLDTDTVRTANCFSPDKMAGKFTIEHITDDKVKDAKLVLKVLSKTSKPSAYFKEGKPVFSVDVSLTVCMEEIASSESEEALLDKFQKTITEPIKDALKEKVITDMTNLFTQTQEKNLDILGVQKTFTQKKYRQWKKYVQSLEDKQRYLKDISLKVNVEVNAGI